jgi:hypothetical protein
VQLGADKAGEAGVPQRLELVALKVLHQQLAMLRGHGHHLTQRRRPLRETASEDVLRDGAILSTGSSWTVVVMAANEERVNAHSGGIQVNRTHVPIK